MYTLTLLQEILLQTGIYWFLGFSLWINFRILKYPDLALENILMAGAMLPIGVSVNQNFAGFFSALVIVSLLAAGIGIFAWSLWKFVKIHPVLVSLIISYLLYSVLLYSFGPQLTPEHIWRLPSSWAGVASLFIAITVVTLLIHLFKKSAIGLRFLAVACNPELARTLGMRVSLYQVGGLSLGFLFGLSSGWLHGMYYGYANISDASGFLLVGLFTVFLAHAIHGRLHVWRNSLFLGLGLFMFLCAMNFAIELGLHPSLTKGSIGVALIALLVTSRFQSNRRSLTF